MATVTVPFEFFEKERNTFYSNWREALFRELFQNSLDANSSEIRIKFEEKEGSLYLWFMDNGCGMTREVLDNVYFALGRTTKGGDSIGGFGRARILTNFSMRSYRILTNEWEVNGSGAEYEITSATSPVKGCWQILCLPDGNIHFYRFALNKFLVGLTAENCNIFVDEKEVTTEYTLGQELSEFLVSGEKCGTVYLNENPEVKLGGHLFVRVGGHPLFVVPYSGKHHFSLELEKKNSREILNANRDGFRGEAAGMFENLLNKISTSLQEMKRPKRQYERKLFLGRGDDIVNRKNSTSSTSPATDGGIFELSPRGIFYTKIEEVRDRVTQANPGIVISVSEFLPNVPFVVNCIAEKKLQAAPWWDSSTWNIKITKNRVDWMGNLPQYRVLMAWRSAIEFSLQTLVDNFYSSPESIRWNAGFCIYDFGTQAEMSQDLYGDCYSFLIDPINDDGKPKFVATEREDLIKILAIAKHEVAHVLYSQHDENYTTVLTTLDSHLDDEKALKIMGDF